MTESALLPPNQASAAIGALLGDTASQRKVLEMAVALSDAGIEPIEIFKVAAMESLRTALKRNKLQSRRKATKKGSEGKEFKIAVEWWKAKLSNHPKPATTVEHQIDPSGKKNLKPAIARAVRRHGKLAKERALFYLAMGDEHGPNVFYWTEWQRYRDELSVPLHKAIKDMPKEISELMLRNLHS